MAEQFAADEMAVLIVDGFEPVEVEEDETEWFGLVVSDVEFCLEQCVKMAGVEETGDVVGDGELLGVGDIQGVLYGDGGVVDEDVQEGDGVVGMLVKVGVEDFQNAVGAFATANGHANGRVDGKGLSLRCGDEAGICGCFGDDESFAGFGDPTGESFPYFDAHVSEARILPARDRPE